MKIPLMITFRHMAHSATLEEKIREKMEHLEKFSEHIKSFRVTLDQSHKHHHQGKLFSITIDITLSGKEIVITRPYRRKQCT